MKKLIALAALVFAVAAQADAVDTLRAFVRDVKSGHAEFTQTVVSPDGARKKTSSGSFDFMRPDRFRFDYRKPYEQLIVADGSKVWIYDPDLEQVSSRKLSAALGSTPAALLAGSSLDTDFKLSALPSEAGIDWALATPKAKDGAFQSMKVGFKGGTLAAVEIVDAFGQHSRLDFSGFTPNVKFDPDSFRYQPPAGADLVEQ